MPATSVTHVRVAPAAAATTKVVTITVSGTNPVLGLNVVYNNAAGVVSSVVSNVGGALTKAIGLYGNTTDSQAANAEIWSLAAPAAGVHVITVTFDGSYVSEVDAWVFQGADQTTPCPIADAVSSQANNAALTLTPANLTANDATVACAGGTSGDPSSVTPNQWTVNTSDTEIELSDGYATGTTGVTLNGNSQWGSDHAAVAVRIVAAGGAPSMPSPMVARMYAVLAAS
jgi:hypothetical protein